MSTPRITAKEITARALELGLYVQVRRPAPIAYAFYDSPDMTGFDTVFVACTGREADAFLNGIAYGLEHPYDFSIPALGI